MPTLQSRSPLWWSPSHLSDRVASRPRPQVKAFQPFALASVNHTRRSLRADDAATSSAQTFWCACRIVLVRGGGIWFYALPDTHCAISIIRIGRADSLAGNRPKLFMRFGLCQQLVFSGAFSTRLLRQSTFAESRQPVTMPLAYGYRASDEPPLS